MELRYTTIIGSKGKKIGAVVAPIFYTLISSRYSNSSCLSSLIAVSTASIYLSGYVGRIISLSILSIGIASLVLIVSHRRLVVNSSLIRKSNLIWLFARLIQPRLAFMLPDCNLCSSLLANNCIKHLSAITALSGSE